MAFVKIIQTLHALNKVLSRDTVIFRIEQMHDADGEECVRYEQVSLTEAIELSVDPDEFRHFVSCVDADVARAYVRVNEVDFEQRAKEMDDNCPVQHTTPSVSSCPSIDGLFGRTVVPRCGARVPSCPLYLKKVVVFGTTPGICDNSRVVYCL